MGNERLRERMSSATGLPVTDSSPQIPSTSSWIWNARPSIRPHSPNAATVAASAPPAIAPMAIDAPTSAAVLPSIIATYSACVTRSRVSKPISAYWPSQSATHASFSVRDAGSTRSGGTPASSRRSSVR